MFDLGEASPEAFAGHTPVNMLLFESQVKHSIPLKISEAYL